MSERANNGALLEGHWTLTSIRCEHESCAYPIVFPALSRTKKKKQAETNATATMDAVLSHHHPPDPSSSGTMVRLLGHEPTRGRALSLALPLGIAGKSIQSSANNNPPAINVPSSEGNSAVVASSSRVAGPIGELANYRFGIPRRPPRDRTRSIPLPQHTDGQEDGRAGSSVDFTLIGNTRLQPSVTSQNQATYEHDILSNDPSMVPNANTIAGGKSNLIRLRRPQDIPAPQNIENDSTRVEESGSRARAGGRLSRNTRAIRGSRSAPAPRQRVPDITITGDQSAQLLVSSSISHAPVPSPVQAPSPAPVIHPSVQRVASLTRLQRHGTEPYYSGEQPVGNVPLCLTVNNYGI